MRAGSCGAGRGRPLVLLVLMLFALSAPAQVVINEVLYDPEGTDTGHEFVELINCGHTDALLSGWVLATGNGANPDDWTVEWIGDDFDVVGPGEVFLIGEDGVVPTPDHSTALDLQNGPDGVRLTDGNDVVDVVGWGEPLFAEYYEGGPAEDVPSGSSLARLPDCYDHDDNGIDFVACSSPTPGTRNAQTMDVSVRARHAGRRIFDAAEPVKLECALRNDGSRAVEAGGCELLLFCDGSQEADGAIVLGSELAPRDSALVAFELFADEGHHRALIEARLEGEGDVTDNTALTSFTVGAPDGFVAVNEVMFSPADDASEWIELVNVSPETVSIGGWRAGDDTDAFIFEVGPSGVRLPPGGYVVVARSAGGVPDAASAVLETDGWEALSADDVVVLLDEHGTCVERVCYTDDWGGGRGVSLERVRADLDPGERANWGGSVAPGGSTPGAVNSIHVGADVASGELTASPNPFSPNGDGRDDRTVLRFELPVPRATARLTVFDARGRERSSFFDGEAVAGSGELIWDGSDADGQPLPTGLYVVLLEAIDAPRGVLVTARTAVALVR